MGQRRDEYGFTLSHAVLLCLIFSSLLYTVYFFVILNAKEAGRGINKLQTVYLAESGNNRALSRLNIKSLPEDVDFEEEVLNEDEEAFFDEDIDDDALLDELEDEDLEEDDKQPEIQFLASIPRYINFYHKLPYYVNIDTGDRVSEAQYYAMIAAQQQRLKKIKEENAGLEEKTEILIQDLYFPLPEVNVRKIGTIPIERGVHLKPGYRIVLAEKTPLKLKQKSIVEEYLNYVPTQEERKPRPRVDAISPNNAMPGEFVEIQIDGENVDSVLPQISSADLSLLEYGSNRMSVQLSEQTKPGRYNIRIGPEKVEFYVVPLATKALNPVINNLVLGQSFLSQQFTEIASTDKIDTLKMTGLNFKVGKNPPIIVPDSKGILIDVLSYKENEIILKIETTKASPGLHYLTVYNEGGSSNDWTFNVLKADEKAAEDPFTGTYTTVMTLLEVNSLSNLPLQSELEVLIAGRPNNSANPNGDRARPTASGGLGRPGTQGSSIKKNFDLLRSDLETVWKLETIATVNKISYKEVRIIRRTAPKLGAAITSNVPLSFGAGNMVIYGIEQARSRLEEPYSSGDLNVILEKPEELKNSEFQSRNDEDAKPALNPTGNAVVEQFGFNPQYDSLSAKGFLEGSFVSVSSSRGGRDGNDYAVIDKIKGYSLQIKEPGFQNGYFYGDEIVQFIPSVISPENISDRDALKYLEPANSSITIQGRESFEYVFNTRFDRIINWASNDFEDTSVPQNIYGLFDGYFGLNIIRGTPSYTGSNALYGQGTLIIDTTRGGLDPNGGVVTMGGSSKSPSVFDGVIYIIGGLHIIGPTEVSGGIIVNSPNSSNTLRVGGSGGVKFSYASVSKAILHLPFVEELNSRLLTKSSGQEELLKK